MVAVVVGVFMVLVLLMMLFVVSLMMLMVLLLMCLKNVDGVKMLLLIPLFVFVHVTVDFSRAV